MPEREGHRQPHKAAADTGREQQMSIMVSSSAQRPALAGATRVALAIVIGMAIAVAGGFALDGRRVAGPASVGGVVTAPDAFPALREHHLREHGGAAATAPDSLQGHLRREYPAAEGGSEPASNGQYTPLWRATAE
jgi:hypothetical protein